MNSKKWYVSRTLWVNVLAVAAIVSQGITGSEIMPPDTQAVMLGVINMALRFITRSEVVW